MQVKLLIAFLALTGILVSCPAFGQSSITVTTDKPSYSDGDTVIISGTVDSQLNIPISIVIKDGSQTPVYIAQTNPGADNTYSVQAVAGGNLWKSTGSYEIDVTYGGPDKTAKTTFQFIGAHPSSTANTENQTATPPAIPEFGPLSAAIFAISTAVVVALYARTRPLFKI